MPNVDARQSPRIAQTWLRIFEPFGNRAFRWFLIFGCCFSCANGLTQTLQFSYPKAILKEEYLLLFTMLAVQTGMRLGQIGVSPTLGKAADRFGNKRMMIFCLILTAQGPLFYFLATPEHWWWFLGAWVVWIAYAGVNIGLPNWILKIAPSAENAGYLAVFYTCTGLCYGLMTLLNGWLSDRFGKCVWEIADARLDFNHAMFLLGWLARLCCIAVLLLVPERSMHRSERRNSRISDIY
jgi:MFS family permease